MNKIVIRKICSKISTRISEKYISKFRKKKLLNNDFSIISNNCWAGWVYRRYGVEYKTPTVGLFIMPSDYIIFLKNLKEYIEMDMEFIKPEDSKYKEYDIKVEHYIVSTGMTQVIKGSSVMPYVEHVWGCELIEGEDNNGEPCISEIGYTIDNTSKTRALFEINKGVYSGDSREGVNANTKIPEEFRRVHFINMVYVADGPSDIPAFSVVNKSGGATFAIYPKGDSRALRQVEQMRVEGRINMYAEADYSEGTMAYMWICNKITEFADRIRAEEREKIAKYAGSQGPKHLVD